MTVAAPDGRTRAIARFTNWKRRPTDDHLTVFVGGDDHHFPGGPKARTALGARFARDRGDGRRRCGAERLRSLDPGAQAQGASLAADRPHRTGGAAVRAADALRGCGRGAQRRCGRLDERAAADRRGAGAGTFGVPGGGACRSLYRRRAERRGADAARRAHAAAALSRDAGYGAASETRRGHRRLHHRPPKTVVPSRE